MSHDGHGDTTDETGATGEMDMGHGMMSVSLNSLKYPNYLRDSLMLYLELMISKIMLFI